MNQTDRYTELAAQYQEAVTPLREKGMVIKDHAGFAIITAPIGEDLNRITAYNIIAVPVTVEAIVRCEPLRLNGQEWVPNMLLHPVNYKNRTWREGSIRFLESTLDALMAGNLKSILLDGGGHIIVPAVVNN